jgi:hypothetical protein
MQPTLQIAADIAINIFKLEMEGFMARKTRMELKKVRAESR